MISVCLHHFLTPSTLWKNVGTAEKEGGMLVFDADILNNFYFFLPTAEITTWLPGESSAHTPATKGLMLLLNPPGHYDVDLSVICPFWDYFTHCISLFPTIIWQLDGGHAQKCRDEGSTCNHFFLHKIKILGLL